MANFNISFKKTIQFEGGYSNNPNDPGEETYKGISRRYFPKWVGWAYVDNNKNNKDFPNCLEDNTGLKYFVRWFYRYEFWEIFRGAELSYQKIANELFDASVNSGIDDGGKFLQKALNVVKSKRREILLEEDGIVGSKTIAVENSLNLNESTDVLFCMSVFRACHIFETAIHDSDFAQLVDGVINRISLRYMEKNK
jgi:lysozyme family protein